MGGRAAGPGASPRGLPAPLTPSPARVGRLRGYRQALTEWGVEFDPRLVFDVQPDQGGGFAAVREILRSEATAVFRHNDRVAMGPYDGLRDRGPRVPEDLSVVGFDSQEVIAAHLRPPAPVDGGPAA
ncbi:substrate-binding domain-containing protein [Streptomyces sp. NPDC051133]|uniref:substrate-binding domain-containing protein n=1 Tax=Streptomyces sp. NPDC051133 TaxID=3155521 RepID=UPI0034239B22